MSRIHRPYALALLVALALGGCAAPKEKAQSPAAIRAAIEDVGRAFSAAFGRDDTLVLSSLYTDDAVLLPPNHEPVQGREAIAAFWAPLLTPAMKSFDIETSEVGGSGNEVWERGAYVLTAADGSTADQGKYLVVYRLQSDGGWRLYRDMWSSNLPAAPPAGK